MTYVIQEACVNVKDGACVEVCPVDCIHTTDEDKIYYIDPDECIDCAACEPVCPVTAIFEESALPAKSKPWTKINADWFKDKLAARQAIDVLMAQMGGSPAPAAH